MRIRKEDVSKFDVWLMSISEELKREGNEVILSDVAYVCWQIWKVRCEMVMEKKANQCGGGY